MNKRIKQLLILLCLTTVLILPYFVFAGNTEALEASKEKNPLQKLKDIQSYTGYSPATELSFSEILGTVVSAFLGLLGIIFIILMIYAGYNWMTAQGDEGKIEKARNTIIAAVIGMTVVVGAFGITSFITSRLVQNTQGSAPVDAGAVGDQPLGCCVIDLGATEAYRIDTHVECKRIADGIEAGRPFIWTGNISAPACQRFCE